MSIEVGGIDIGSLQKASTLPTSLRGAITYAAGTTGAIGSTTLFTITGDVAISFLAAKCTTSCTSGGLPTFTVGVTGQTDMLGTTFPSVVGWTAGLWADPNIPGYQIGGGINQNLIGNASAKNSPVPISANILQTIAVATITGGVVRWYLQYIPLSGDGAVALHANLVAF